MRHSRRGRTEDERWHPAPADRTGVNLDHKQKGAPDRPILYGCRFGVMAVGTATERSFCALAVEHEPRPVPVDFEPVERRSGPGRVSGSCLATG